MGEKGPVFILGTARSGSTALAELISHSLGLELVRGKESHFLAASAIPDQSGGPDGPRFDRLRDRTITDFYARLPRGFRDTRFLDASSSSLYYASAAVKSLNQHFPNARLVAVLRNPVDRAESAHSYMKARGLERLEISDALHEEPFRVANRWPHIWHYANAGFYADQIAALGEWRQRTLFLLYEQDLRSETLMERISEHTGYPIIRRPQLEKRNEARSFSSPAVGRAAEWIRSSKMVATAPQWVRKGGRAWVNRFRSPLQRDSDPIVRAELYARFRDQRGRLTELTGLDINSWFDGSGD
ncbi:sulfotransferase [Mycolicibacterium sp. XJ879]